MPKELNQSISEEFRKKFAAPKWAPEKMQDIFNELMFGKDGVLDFWESEISQALAARDRELKKKIEEPIVEEMLICHEEGTPTSRLTSLRGKLIQLLEEK